MAGCEVVAVPWVGFIVLGGVVARRVQAPLGPQSAALAAAEARKR